VGVLIFLSDTRVNSLGDCLRGNRKAV